VSKVAGKAAGKVTGKAASKAASKVISTVLGKVGLPKLKRAKRVDHAEASSHFIAAKDHIAFHDQRLWDLRKKRDRESEEIPEWQELRALASAIKEHTLTHLADYLEEFERNAKKNGAHVHWARDAAEHNQIVYDILTKHGARTLVKGKSMLTDECEMPAFLGQRGIEIIETDLGERIQQLDGEPPSHIVVPAVHKLRADVAQVFARTIGTDPKSTDVPYLAESQRQHTRPYYLKAGAGMTGANFAIAETGTIVTCTNEGNADLSVNLPKLHIASVGIEKIIPKIEHLGVFVRLLSRSALGSPITQITSHFRAPRPGTEMHIVLVDNGRSERLGMHDFWYSLKCIRCGACLNTCPVYRRSGGLSYGATYSGPIGVIIDPTFNLRKFSALPFASTLNGSCTNVCPVKINIHEQIYKWRQIINERNQLPIVKKESMRMAGKVLASPALYRTAVKAANAGLDFLPRTMIYNPLNAWGRQREVPKAPQLTFRDWYLKNRGKKK
jgi:L-lactate dehydrogenase complex protein LldF